MKLQCKRATQHRQYAVIIMLSSAGGPVRRYPKMFDIIIVKLSLARVVAYNGSRRRNRLNHAEILNRNAPNNVEMYRSPAAACGL